MGVGGGSQDQSSNQMSQGVSQSYGSAMNLAQERQFQNLWGNAGNLFNQDAGAGAGYQGYNAAIGGNQQGMNYLGAGAGQVGASLSNLGPAQGFNQAGVNTLGQAGQAYNTLGNLQNPTVDPMLGVYAQQIGQQFNRQVLPGIQGQAALGGGLGGSRAGIAQGLAAGEAQRNIQNFGAQLYGQGQDRALQAAGQQGDLVQGLAQGYQNAAGLQNQFAQAGLQGAGMYGQLGQQAMQGGLNNLAIGQFGMGVPWYAAQQYAGLLGNPIMEDLGGRNESWSSGTGSGSGSNFKAYIW